MKTIVNRQQQCCVCCVTSDYYLHHIWVTTKHERVKSPSQSTSHVNIAVTTAAAAAAVSLKMDLNKASEPGGTRLAEPSAGLDPGGGGGVNAGSRRASSNRPAEYCLEHRKSASGASAKNEMVATAGADGDVKTTTGPPPLKSPVSLGGSAFKRGSFFKFPLLFERASQTW